MKSLATTAGVVMLTASIAWSAPATAHDHHDRHHHHRTTSDAKLTPRTHFTMKADGSSAAAEGGEGIPNIDVVKATIRTYYGADSTGVASRTSSPYITEMKRLLAAKEKQLPALLADAKKHHKKPAIVFDADDTTLWTYDMQDAAMHFQFDPALQDEWVQAQRFEAVPAMVAFERKAQAMGFTVFGITGRNDNQKSATVNNLAKVGYRGFTEQNFYTKWTGVGTSQKPAYLTCATVKCTTVEYKAGTRKHIQSMGYSIAMNLGDQWSDLQGGQAKQSVKLPNPTSYLPSPNLPGRDDRGMGPHTHFTMKADGSSGRTVGGEHIPNIDAVKATIRTYYGADSSGRANKADSPYIREMAALTRRVKPGVLAACREGKRHGTNPAIVLDADDTTLWTYDMEDAAMHFQFDPALQDEWVQAKRFRATPSMVALANDAAKNGCAIIGLTGRSASQKDATLANLRDAGYTGFTAANYLTKWAPGAQPEYITCVTSKCSTIEYKSQTRAFKESKAGGRYHIVANFGDQYSDLIGGHARTSVKLPNPTYYLP